MSGISDKRGSPENAKTMRGWEINEYGGIDALTFSENILLPQINSPTDVLVEVIATSVNPIDQLQTGECVCVCVHQKCSKVKNSISTLNNNKN